MAYQETAASAKVTQFRNPASDGMNSAADCIKGVESAKSSVAPVEHALELFNQMSVHLTHSYRTLEKKVSELKCELKAEVEQRQAELEEKQRLANRLTTLLELLPAGVVVIDAQGVVTECNPAAVGLLGEPLEGLRWLEIIQRCFAPRRDDGHEVSLKDGRRVRIETRSMSNGPGQLILLSDLTETRALQEKVSRAERLSSLGRMVASLAHQIRTPLTTAMLYAGHLRQPEMGEAMRVRCADKVLHQLTHLEQQIRDMLIFAKGETRLAETLSLGELLHCLQQSAEAPLASAAAKVNWQIPEKDAALRILCNKETLVGACLNLINNSLEAVASDPVITVGFSAQGEKAVKLQITDNGPGFDDSRKKRMLEAFYTTKPQGTGLGLAVVQAVVGAHAGKFTINSTDHGATASIYLPIHETQTISERKAEATNV